VGERAVTANGAPLSKVDSYAVTSGQEGGAHWAGRFARRIVHHAVDHQCVFVAEEARELNWGGVAEELEVPRNLATLRQRTPLGRHPFEAAQLDFFLKQRTAGSAILGAFI
jgi:hypothetical protein